MEIGKEAAGAEALKAGLQERLRFRDEGRDKLVGRGKASS